MLYLNVKKDTFFILNIVDEYEKSVHNETAFNISNMR